MDRDLAGHAACRCASRRPRSTASPSTSQLVGPWTHSLPHAAGHAHERARRRRGAVGIARRPARDRGRGDPARAAQLRERTRRPPRRAAARRGRLRPAPGALALPRATTSLAIEEFGLLVARDRQLALRVGARLAALPVARALRPPALAADAHLLEPPARRAAPRPARRAGPAVGRPARPAVVPAPGRVPARDPGHAGASPQLGSTEYLLGGRWLAGVGSALVFLLGSIRSTLVFFLVLFLLRVLLRRTWLVGARLRRCSSRSSRSSPAATCRSKAPMQLAIYTIAVRGRGALRPRDARRRHPDREPPAHRARDGQPLELVRGQHGLRLPERPRARRAGGSTRRSAGSGSGRASSSTHDHVSRRAG